MQQVKRERELKAARRARVRKGTIKVECGEVMKEQNEN